MKNFFYIVFGGLGILLISLGIFSLGTVILSKTGNHSSSYNVADAIVSKFENNFNKSTQVSVPRYSASQEEDVINSALGTSPHNTTTQIGAKAYFVKNLTTGEIVAKYNQDQLLPIASLTKLITAVLARQLIDDNARIIITKSVMATYGNTADFVAGETFSANDLLYPLLMVSSNDAAEAYADYYGRKKFIQAMNDFTQSIGAYRTYIVDPSGLDPRNASTASDMALILDWIRKNDPTIIGITELKAYTIRSHTWINPAHFLSWSYYIGGKNGYLPESNRTNVSLFKWGSKSDIYVISVLDSTNRDADTIALLKKIK